MCVHIKWDWQDCRASTQICFYGGIKKNQQIQTGSKRAQQVQEDSDGPSSTEREIYCLAYEN